MYHYTGCGLDNIWLDDGYSEVQTPYGVSVSVEDVKGLHKAIGNYLVDSKPELSGKEFRFLRNELEMSQPRLGELIGVDGQTVANWEKDHVQPYGDRFIRLLYKLYVGGDPNIVALVDRLNGIDKSAYVERVSFFFQEGDDGWKRAA